MQRPKRFPAWPRVNRLLAHLEPIVVHQLRELTILRLVDEDVDRIAVQGQARPDQEKITEMSAQKNDAATLRDCAFEMFPAGNRNCPT